MYIFIDKSVVLFEIKQENHFSLNLRRQKYYFLKKNKQFSDKF